MGSIGRWAVCTRFAFAEQRAYTSLHNNNNNNIRISTHSRPHMHTFFTRISLRSRNESNKLFIHAAAAGAAADAASPVPAMMMTIILVFFISCPTFLTSVLFDYFFCFIFRCFVFHFIVTRVYNVLRAFSFSRIHPVRTLHNFDLLSSSSASSSICTLAKVL